MGVKLIRVEDALRPVLAALPPVPVRRVAVHDAIGFRLAAPLVAPSDVPASTIARRAGLAVRSFDLVGASSHAPVILNQRLSPVAINDVLPDGCDAVIDPAAVLGNGPLIEIAESVEPGAHVRLPGHDLRAGTVLLARGERVTAELALACAGVGIAEVAILAPGVRVDVAAGPRRDWLLQRLRSLGCDTRDAAALLVLREADRASPPRLALQPGETSWIEARDGTTIIDMPSRIDGCIAAFVAFILPLVAIMTGTAIAQEAIVLTRKLTSRIGIRELALLEVTGNAATPLGVGDLTLAHVARANAFTLLPPEVEGYAPGECIRVTPFDALLTGPSS